MLHVDQSPRAYEVQSKRLRLGFDFVPGDRWRHWVDVRTTDPWQRVLNSVEGSPDEAHPPSPAFQDLRCEVCDSRTAEFQLFGQAGQRVFSAAVRFDGRREEIDFDVSCRLPPHFIGTSLVSSYCWPDDCRLNPVAAGRERPRLRLTPHSVEIDFPSPPHQHPAGWRTATQTAEVVLQLGCFDVTHAATAKSAVTVRWHYRIRIPSSSSAAEVPP